MRRNTLLAYVAAALAYEWLSATARRLGDAGFMAPIAGLVETVTFGIVAVAGIGLLFLPAAVLSLRLRDRVSDGVKRYLVTAAIWVGWAALLAIIAARGGSGTALSAGPVLDVVLLGIAAFVFTWLLPARPWAPGRKLTIAASLLVVAVTVAAVGSLVLAVGAT